MMNHGTASIYGGNYQTVMPSVKYGGRSGPFSGYGLVSYLHDGIGMANTNCKLPADPRRYGSIQGLR